MIKKLQEFFQNFPVQDMLNNKKQLLELHKLALERALTPGGIIRQDKNQKWQLHRFASLDNIDELWIFTSSDRSGKAGWTVWDPTLLLQRKDLIHGMVFFVPLDNRKTGELAGKYRQLFDKSSIPTGQWPENWPLNMR